MESSPARPIRNVLLLLSTKQPPPPREEIASLAARSRGGQLVAFVTTRIVTGLAPGESVVAFYGDQALGNAFLGCGVFEKAVSLETPLAATIARVDELYGVAGIPEGSKSLLVLRDVRCADDEETLDVLRGTISASGQPLTVENLPKSAARIQVYYETREARVGVDPHS